MSGSGKSTLIKRLLYPALQNHLTKKIPFPKYLSEDIDKSKGFAKYVESDVFDEATRSKLKKILK